MMDWMDDERCGRSRTVVHFFAQQLQPVYSRLQSPDGTVCAGLTRFDRSPHILPGSSGRVASVS